MELESSVTPMAVLNMKLLNLRMGVKSCFPQTRQDHILVRGYELVHLVESHCINVDLVMLFADELVGAVACFAGAAVEQEGQRSS